MLLPASDSLQRTIIKMMELAQFLIRLSTKLT
jgi:hypothetical protein